MSKSKFQTNFKAQNPNDKKNFWILDFIWHLSFGFFTLLVPQTFLRKDLRLLSLIISCYLLSAGTVFADWPMFMKDPVHSSYSSDTLSLPLKLKWRFKTDGPIYSSPVVYGKMVFWGSYDSYMYALDAESGMLIWKIKTDGPILSTPAVSGGVIYFGSKDGWLYAVSIKEGNLLWRYETGGKVLTSPVVADDMVFIGSNDYFFYALGAKDGRLIWRNKVLDYKYGGLYSSPIYSGAVVYIISKSGIVNAFDAKSGAKVWAYRTATSAYSSPSIHKGNFHIATYSRILLALDAEKGTLIWQAELGEWPYSSPVAIKDSVYIGLKNGSVKSFNIKDGKPEKEYKFPDELNSTMAVSKNNIAVIGCDDGGLYALNLEKNEVSLQYMTNGGIHSSPAIANGIVYVGSKDGFAYAFGP